MAGPGVLLALALQATFGPPVPVADRPTPRSPDRLVLAGGIAGRGDAEVGRGTDDIRRRIRDGRDSGQLSRGDARDLRRDTNYIDTLTERYTAAGPLSDSARRELDFRSNVLREQVDNARTTGRTGRK